VGRKRFRLTGRRKQKGGKGRTDGVEISLQDMKSARGEGNKKRLINMEKKDINRREKGWDGRGRAKRSNEGLTFASRRKGDQKTRGTARNKRSGSGGDCGDAQNRICSATMRLFARRTAAFTVEASRVDRMGS